MRFSPLPIPRLSASAGSDAPTGSDPSVGLEAPVGADAAAGFENSATPARAARYANRARVLFVCYGNACRSQMAEGFARAYHADVIEAESAGVSPLGFIPEETNASMLERDVSLKNHRSKGLDAFDLRSFDLIVNMSGFPFPSSLGRVVHIEEWEIEDPYLGNERRYRKVRNEIEKRLIRLANRLRSEVAETSV